MHGFPRHTYLGRHLPRYLIYLNPLRRRPVSVPLLLVHFSILGATLDCVPPAAACGYRFFRSRIRLLGLLGNPD
jgi:hypothetical protein